MKRVDGIFSQLETDIINAVGRRQIKITDLVEKIYDKPGPSAKQTVASLVRRIESKCEYHKLDWTLRGEGLGRNGKIIWRAER